ncbi:MAG TPA: ribonuclease HII [Nitrospirota bacterium]|nr:ribonuclease HII [Nitrospirota bacterium]
MPRGRPHGGNSHQDRIDDLFGNELVCDPLFFEVRARASGFTCIAGLDEAGRGPLAGPVVAAAVVLPVGLLIPGLKDSKQVPEQDRERLFDKIREQATCYSIGIVDERTIDDVNILRATIIAMERALETLALRPDYLLIDALILPRVPLPQKPLIKGDCRSHSIAAASILAKVTRDRLMLELHEKFPQYNFQKNKGYGTREHMELLRRHGPCDAHRKSFNPVAQMLRGEAR